MFGHESGVAIGFRLLNFAILIGLAIYGYRRYVRGSAQEMIKAEDARLLQLQQQRELLKGQQRGLDHQLEDQDLEGERLLRALDRWNIVIAQQAQAHVQERERIRAQIAKKFTVQAHNRALTHIQKQVMPLVQQEAKTQLQQQFKDAEAGMRYVQQLVNYLERGSV